MEESKEYIKDAFTKSDDNINLEVDNLNVGCITSKNNSFNLDQSGNLTVKSIEVTDGLIGNTSLLNIIYPIGTIYMSVNNIDPADIFGGTWEKIREKFLFGEGESFEAGTTGGETTHILTVDEMPTHTHTMTTGGNHNHTANFLEVRSKISGQSSNNVARPNNSSYDSTGTITTSNGSHSHSLNSAGSGQAHNNMPPYLAVYMWKRVN